MSRVLGFGGGGLHRFWELGSCRFSSCLGAKIVGVPRGGERLSFPLYSETPKPSTEDLGMMI